MVKYYSKKTLVVHKNAVKTLEDTEVGDMILTGNGYDKVIGKEQRPVNVRDMVEMVFNTPSGSYHLLTTRDARMITMKGEVEVNKTRGRDEIIVLDLKGKKEVTHVETAWCIIREPNHMYNLILAEEKSFFANGILVKAAEEDGE